MKEASLQAQVEGAKIKIQVKAQAKIQVKAQSQNLAQGQRYDKSQVQCHFFKKYGHYVNEYRKKKRDRSNKPSENFTKENQNQESVFLSCNVEQEKQRGAWFLDSG